MLVSRNFYKKIKLVNLFKSRTLYFGPANPELSKEDLVNSDEVDNKNSSIITNNTEEYALVKYSRENNKEKEENVVDYFYDI